MLFFLLKKNINYHPMEGYHVTNLILIYCPNQFFLDNAIVGSQRHKCKRIIWLTAMKSFLFPAFDSNAI